MYEVNSTGSELKYSDRLIWTRLWNFGFRKCEKFLKQLNIYQSLKIGCNQRDVFGHMIENIYI
jgi:hypothetical protein